MAFGVTGLGIHPGAPGPPPLGQVSLCPAAACEGFSRFLGWAPCVTATSRAGKGARRAREGGDTAAATAAGSRGRDPVTPPPQPPPCCPPAPQARPPEAPRPPAPLHPRAGHSGYRNALFVGSLARRCPCRGASPCWLRLPARVWRACDFPCFSLKCLFILMPLSPTASGLFPRRIEDSLSVVKFFFAFCL